MKLTERHKDALEKINAEDFSGAAEILNMEPGGGSWLLRNDLALCQYMLGDADGAVELLDRIIEDDPGNGFAAINRFYVAEAQKVRSSPPPDPKSRVKEARGEGPDSPLVTVVMPTFNRPDMIRESIESIKAQTMRDWELIVVNDGGDRAVERTMEGYLDDKRIRYVYAEHGGLSSARNVGMALARGEYITQLDDDDVYYPDHLETLAAFLKDHPEFQGAYSDTNRAFQEKKGDAWVTVEKRVPYSVDFDPRAMRHQSYIPVTSIMHSRRCVAEAGYYNEHILRAMDWEYFIRLSKRCKLKHINKVTNEQRQRSDRSQMTRTFEVPRNYFRNLISFIHGFFPLTGARFISRGQGSGDKLKKTLDRLLRRDDDEFFMRRLELRKLLVEPYYALFYTLGKRLSEEGHSEKSRQALRAAIGLRPYEIKAWARFLKPQKRG
jgi:glycosyltransferase involved in cell wall biosynthesis